METMTAAPQVALPQENAAAPQPASPVQPASTPPAAPTMAEIPVQSQLDGSQPEVQPAMGMVTGTLTWRRQIVDQVSHFHVQVSDSHRQFLAQQARAMDMLAGLGAQAMAAQGVAPPVMQRVAPTAPQVHVPSASMPQAPVAAPAPKPAVSPVVAPDRKSVV